MQEESTWSGSIELELVVRQYIEHCRSFYSRRHVINISCALAHLKMNASDLSWASLLQAAHNYATDTSSTPNYRRAVIRIWRQFLAWACEAGHIEGSILTMFCTINLRFPQNPDIRIYSPKKTPDQTHKAMRKTLPYLKTAYRDIVNLLALTGARPSEILRLKNQDIHQVEQLAVIYRHKCSWRDPTPRLLSLSSQALAIIDRHYRPFCPEDWLFPAPKNRTKPLETMTLAQAIRRQIKRRLLPKWALYELRKAAGSLTRSHLGLDAAQALLGHKDSRTTERYYAPVDTSKARQATDLLDELLGGDQ